MKAIVALSALFCLVAGSSAQNQPADNSKIAFLAAEWVGKVAFRDEGESSASITGSNYLRGRFIRLDLKFESERMGKIEGMAMLSTGEDGVIRGYFFISEEPDPLVARGQLKDKKLTFVGTPLEGDGEVQITFTITSPEAFNFEILADGAEMLRGSFTKKKTS